MFRWSESATEQQRQAAVESLGTLRERVPGIRRLSYGTDLGVGADNFDLVLVADFDDLDGYVRYRDHDEHQALVRRYIRPIVAARAAVQYELTEGGA